MAFRTLMLATTLAMLIAGSVAAQPRTGEIDANTEEGKLLATIAQEEDATRKLQLIESFLQKYPQHEGVSYVLSQGQPLYNKAGQFDKALEAGGKLLQADPLDLQASYQNLKASEGKKDAAGVLLWSGRTSDIAKKIVAGPKPADATPEEHASAVDWAKQVDVYTEYSLYATALAEPPGDRVLELTEILEKRNPSSQYLPMLYGKYAVTASQLNRKDAVIALGERAFSRGQYDSDLLLVLIGHNMEAGTKDHAKALEYADKLIESLTGRPAPEGTDAAAWQAKVNNALGVAHWARGTIYSSQNQFAKADEALRTALPLIEDKQQLLSTALFTLGMANYKLAQTGKSKTRAADAVKYFDRCGKIKGAYQAHATKNVQAIRREFGVQ